MMTILTLWIIVSIMAWAFSDLRLDDVRLFVKIILAGVIGVFLTIALFAGGIHIIDWILKQI